MTTRLFVFENIHRNIHMRIICLSGKVGLLAIVRLEKDGIEQKRTTHKQSLLIRVGIGREINFKGILYG